MSKPWTVAIMAAHNRRDTTLRCLRSLFGQEPPATDLAVVLVDDGSTDGTGAAVAAEFPEVDLIEGPGDWFWARSMAEAEKRAVRSRPDFLPWLNDDVVLDPDSIQRMISTATVRSDAVVVGAVREPTNGAVTYGGRRRRGRHPQRFADVAPTQSLQTIDAWHGNVVLVPRSAYETVGAIDGAFAHAYADDDYSLRVTAAGVTSLLLPGTVGTCPANPELARPTGLLHAWRDMQSPKGLPLRSQIRFMRRHGGAEWPVYVAWQYLKLLRHVLHKLQQSRTDA